MQQQDGRLLFSPSDLNAFLACPHLTQLELAVARGELEHPVVDNPEADLLRRKGEEHEEAYLQSLLDAGAAVVAIDRGDATWDLARAARDTEAAMRDGAEVIYQAVLFEDDWRGLADFLERIDEPSSLGSWSYEVADAKLARRSKPAHVLQLSFYTEQVARIQGRQPERMHLLLGSGERETLRPADFAAYFRRVRARFLDAVAARADVYPYPVSHCELCDFTLRCQERWQRDDHLSLVAGMRRDQVSRLQEAGIARLDDLAVAPAGIDVPRMVDATLEKLRDQAALQYAERRTGSPSYRLLEPVEKRGFGLLPAPARGDLFFDIEGDPFWAPDRGLEYLFGVLWFEGEAPSFRTFWAHDRDQERRSFEALVDFFHERLRDDPALHIYHYAAYETIAMRRLAAVFGTREEAVDDLLRREVFVDLFAVLRQSMRVSRPSYSLKEIEMFYLDEREAELRSGGGATVEYERWRESRDPDILAGIEDYNREDCLSTALLRDWLVERRREAEVTWGATIDWWTPPEPRERSEEAAAALSERQQLKRELIEGAEEGEERWYAGELLDYHRREAKPVWWSFFARLKRTSEELAADRESIGELSWDGQPAEQRGQSRVFGFTFPAQEHRLDVRDEVYDPVTGERAGRIDQLDDEAGTLRLLRGPALEEAPLPGALIPGGPYQTWDQQLALGRLARSARAGDGRYGALRGILRRDYPRLRNRPAGAALQTIELEELRLLVSALDDSHLFVQGPPGAGKTWTGARLIVHLLGQGHRVGVTSTSHKAIHTLLGEVEEAARTADVLFQGLKKSSADNPESLYQGEQIVSSSSIAAFTDPEVQLVAGTAWLFAREELDSTVDYLFVDEAGQVSLADALAVGTAARNLVLLGDPLQLAHVTQGIHPAGTAVSVLQHLLGDARTIPRERGIFLELTWRMHPDVSRFVSEAFYEGRLRSAAECARQRTAFGTGVRYLPVEHEGNRQSSPEEGERIASELDRLLGTSWTDSKGATTPLREEDVLVVAPYNAQVRSLREQLPAAVRVGTVDKFQGQEAAVVFFSMASSSGADIPRNLGFLFSRNRLNVAVSRARCLAYLVASPRLLEVDCRTVEQMRLANSLCLLVETAERARALV